MVPLTFAVQYLRHNFGYRDFDNSDLVILRPQTHSFLYNLIMSTRHLAWLQFYWFIGKSSDSDIRDTKFEDHSNTDSHSMSRISTRVVMLIYLNPRKQPAYTPRTFFHAIRRRSWLTAIMEDLQIHRIFPVIKQKNLKNRWVSHWEILMIGWVLSSLEYIQT